MSPTAHPMRCPVCLAQLTYYGRLVFEGEPPAFCPHHKDAEGNLTVLLVAPVAHVPVSAPGNDEQQGKDGPELRPVH